MTFLFFKHGLSFLRKPKNTGKLVWLHISRRKIVIVYDSQRMVIDESGML